MRPVQSAALAAVLWGAASITAFAQTPRLVFTVAAPEPEPAPAELRVNASPIIEERGLALWRGTATDVGVGVDVVARGWSVRSITSMTMLPLRSDVVRPTFLQAELLRTVLARPSISLAVGGGIRQEWDGTQVLIGRAVAGAQLAGGRLQGSFVLERSDSSFVRRDAADVVTSLGWSRRVSQRIAFGVEGVGQDLEGFWDPEEAEGGARLLVGPSVHVQSRRGTWSATATAGPVLRSTSTIDMSGQSSAGRHYGIFASATWMPFQ